MSSRIKNLSQRRAAFAYERVKEVNSWEQQDQKEFKSHVKDIPMMIKTNGLPAAFAFAYGKKGRDYQALIEITRNWLEAERKFFQPEEGKNFHEKLLSLDQNQSRMAIREIMALFTWLKRYADGMLNTESE